MEEGAAAGYAEMVELSTLSKHVSQVLLLPSSSTEDRELPETYLIPVVHHKGESLPEVSKCAKPNSPRGHYQSGPITYRKASEIEDISCLHYENVSVSTLRKPEHESSVPAQGTVETGFPQNVLMTSEAEYIDCFYYGTFTEPSTSHEKHEPSCVPHTSAASIHQQTENNLTLSKKLEISRRRMSCFNFTCYAMEAVYNEVEQNAVLGAIFSFFSLGILVIGFIYLDGCRTCPQIPVALVCSGVMDSVANIISFGFIFKSNCRNCFRDIARAIRLLMLTAHIYGLVLVYEALYPEEADRGSTSYCNSYLYWLGFAYFHLAILTTMATIIAMITVSLFYLSQKNKYVVQ